MKTLSFLVKPVSAGCQLNCTYCFYKDIAENRSRANYGRMRNEVAVALLEKVFQAADADADITFAFQGGEPLLAGLPFYEQFADAVKQLRQPKQNVRYAIQTNGCLLNAAWCSFFISTMFLSAYLWTDGESSMICIENARMPVRMRT